MIYQFAGMLKVITVIHICSFKQESGCMGRPRSPYFKQECFVRILLPKYLQIANTGKKLFFLIFSCSHLSEWVLRKMLGLILSLQWSNRMMKRITYWRIHIFTLLLLLLGSLNHIGDDLDMKHKGMGNICTTVVKKSQRHKLGQENLKMEHREAANGPGSLTELQLRLCCGVSEYDHETSHIMEVGLFSWLTSFLAWSLNITWVYTKRPHTPYFT